MRRLNGRSRLADTAVAECPHTTVVALVCSAGGLDAIRHILTRLPAGFPAAVIVLRHHTPDSHDRLAAILSRSVALPVATARDGDALLAGHVLVAPAGYHTLVTADGRVALIESGDRPPYRPSADLLLSTLATAAGPRAVAVVLSGHGNRFGGIVIASDAATSTVFAMPHATISREETVDHVVPLDQIPALLAALVGVGRR